MNSLFLSQLPTNSTQITGVVTPFSTATFYAISGFGAQGAPVYDLKTGQLYIGANSGQQPITITSGTSATINANINPSNPSESLSKYFVTSQNALNSLYVTYS